MDIDIHTGIARLARAVRWTGRALATGVVALAAFAAASRAPDAGSVGGFFLVAGLLVGAIGDAIAWVIEGFVQA